MSYILDALRRADSERERGEVPSLHTQQYGALPGDDEAPARPRLLVGIIVALVLALGAALAWNLWGSDAGHRGTAQGTISAAPPAPKIDLATASVPSIVAPAASSVAPVITPAAPLPATPVIAPARPAASSPRLDARRRLGATAPRAAPPERRRSTREDSAAASTAAPIAAPTAAAGDNLGKLPEAMRRELPALAFGGSSYSRDAASRMVIFNGRVFHEGDTVAPQLVLQQIKLKSSVLVFKGYRYELEY